jgi:hypothetical protein
MCKAADVAAHIKRRMAEQDRDDKDYRKLKVMTTKISLSPNPLLKCRLKGWDQRRVFFVLK